MRRPVVRRADGRALLAVLLIAGLLGFYAYKRWSAEPPVGIVGVAWVADGDTIEIAGTRIRLQGIDAPELEQTCTDANGQAWPCGRAASRGLRAHIRGQELKCEQQGFDRFRRVLAICFLPDGSDVNAWMVRQGWAVAFGFSSPYQAEQDEAKAAKRGLWVGSFTPPGEWRRSH